MAFVLNARKAENLAKKEANHTIGPAIIGNY